MTSNQLIVDDRNTGKTTYLFSKVEELIREGATIFILDSATDHEDKSLLKKVYKKYQNSVIIDMKNSQEVVIDKIGFYDFVKNFMNYFPFKDVVTNKNKIICFDLSYFLEKGHDIYDETNSIEMYNYYRQIYNSLSQQIIVNLILMEKFGIISNSTVVMDEIEFPIVDYDISLSQGDLSFLASVHPENSFGTFYQSFEKIEFISYEKRKER